MLNTNKKKLMNDGKLEMVDAAIREWEELGVIEEVTDYDRFAQNCPSHSFLAHMPVFRLDKETTKCRVVFLSNLCGKDKNYLNPISHNQAMDSGPCLSQKLSIALLLLRFDQKVLCFDLNPLMPDFFNENFVINIIHLSILLMNMTIILIKFH